MDRQKQVKVFPRKEVKLLFSFFYFQVPEASHIH